MLSSKGDNYVTASPCQGSGNIPEEGTERLYGLEAEEDYRIIVSSGHDTILVHKNLH